MQLYFIVTDCIDDADIMLQDCEYGDVAASALNKCDSIMFYPDLDSALDEVEKCISHDETCTVFSFETDMIESHKYGYVRELKQLD